MHEGGFRQKGNTEFEKGGGGNVEKVESLRGTTPNIYLGIALRRRLVDYRLVLLLLDLNIFVVHLPEQGVQFLLVPPVPV